MADRDVGARVRRIAPEPTNVTVHRVPAAVELGDARRARGSTATQVRALAARSAVALRGWPNPSP